MAQTEARNRQRRCLTVDGGIVTALCALTFFPTVTGEAAHEWLGLVFGIALVVHTARRWFPHKGRGALVLQAALLVDVAVCTVSGLGLSGAVLPSLGLYVSGGYYLWEPVHAASAKLLLVLALFHLVYQCDRRHPRQGRRECTARVL
ncbi:MAG: DUF4405 domain-containing protein [Eggerthellaceae bacterium]|jgi:hypothetical protein